MIGPYCYARLEDLNGSLCVYGWQDSFVSDSGITVGHRTDVRDALRTKYRDKSRTDALHALATIPVSQTS